MRNANSSPLFSSDEDLPILTEIVSARQKNVFKNPHPLPTTNNPPTSPPQPQGVLKTFEPEKQSKQSLPPISTPNTDPPTTAPLSKNASILEAQARQLVEKLLEQKTTPLQKKLLDQLSKDLPVMMMEQLRDIIHKTVSKLSQETLSALLSSTGIPKDKTTKNTQSLYASFLEHSPSLIQETRIVETDFPEEPTHFVLKPNSENSDEHKTNARDIVGSKTQPTRYYDDSEYQTKSTPQNGDDRLLSI